MTETILGEQAQLQLQEELKEEPAEDHEELQDALESCVVYGPWRREEEILPLLTEEGSGKEAVEEHQEHNLPLPPIDSVYIFPTPATHSNSKTPTTKAIQFALPTQQNFKKLVATVQAYATTSKTLAATHTACHSGWFECWFRHGAPGPQHSCKLHQFQQPPKARETGLGGLSIPPLFVLIFLVLFYFILISLIFLFRFF